MKTLPQHDPWHMLRQHTAARIAIGRCGASLPTHEVLGFGVAHAQARDAVHLPLDTAELHAEVSALGLAALCVASQAATRDVYLKRPDFGRLLSANSEQALLDVASPHGVSPCVVFVLADGLSALATTRHAIPLLQATLPLLDGWRIGPVIIAEQARVAFGDPVARVLNAQAVVVLLGERPGLSAADSLGAYLTYAPRPSTTDADRNCISNIRPEGLPYRVAAQRIAYLLNGARLLGCSGVRLKDDSEDETSPQIQTHPTTVLIQGDPV